MPSFAGINGLDIAVALLLLVSAAFAYFRGLVHEVLSITGWIGAAAAAIYGFPVAQPFFRQVIETKILADIAAGLGLFLVALVILSLLARAASRRVKDSALGALDRALGFLFGLVRGGLIVCIAYLIYIMVVPPKDRPEWAVKARTAPMMGIGAQALVALLPTETAARLGLGGAARAPTGSTKAPIPGATPTGPAVQDLLKPPSQTPEAPAQEGYGEKERQDMQRLIDSTGRDKR